jgi:D-alanyl-lipoteichoic acid acyltransferase DltB (MBOAT superfamily)|nr:MBOAT family O-acyltransferase [uncultured Psychroserpens sp.]
MLFNSIDFALFLPIVFLLYWFLVNKSLKLQNLLIVFSSYLFYGWWDWRFLFLILFSTIVDYLVGLEMAKSNSQKQKKAFLWISIFVNLGLLCFFKYYNFFLENFVSAFSFFGTNIESGPLQIILPVGISFYTFQTLSYTIDIYRGKLQPTRDFVVFSAFVSFFPQLVAGPIERATNLLPQFQNIRVFNNRKATDGLKQILWGLFKKIVIADNAALIANQIFNNSENYSGSTLIVGAICFTFQIYGDFSGYSDIAIGTSRLFGFDLKQNFAFPYFSRDIAEFWRRWHISLSTWFRDYLYIPLGGNKGSKFRKIRNVFAIFIVSGFWHGANWTFVAWGFLNALFFLPLMLLDKNRKNTGVVAENKILPSIKEFAQIVLTFSLTVFAWIFFRASSITQAFQIILDIFSASTLRVPEILPKRLIIIISLFMCIEWVGRNQKYAIESLTQKWSKPIRWVFYYVLIVLIYFLGNFSKDMEFIYFQF